MNRKLFNFTGGTGGGGSGLTPRGNWDADTNTPDITAEATVGDYWIVSVPGATDLNGITTWLEGDKAIVGEDGFMRDPAVIDRRADLEFVDADLTAGVLTVSGTDPIAAVVDNSGVVVAADDITYGVADTTVDLSSFGTITGTWKVKFARGPQGNPGFANPMTAEGDIIIGGTGGAAEALPAGTDGHVLTLASGVPAWAAGGGGGGDFLVMQVFS